MIHLIDLNLHKQIFPLITQKLVDIIEEQIAQGNHTLIVHNRRGQDRLTRCKDCGHIWKCVWCDVPLISHNEPSKHLECHLCYSPSEYPTECPHCRGGSIVAGLPGTQGIEESLKKIFAHQNIVRVESDIRRDGKKVRGAIRSIEEPHIFISTRSEIQEYLPIIQSVIYVLLESDFSLGMYDTSESLYQEIAWGVDRGQEIVIQTLIPRNTLVEQIFSQNSKGNLETTLHERKLYHLPPYSRYARLTFSGRNHEDVAGTSLLWRDKIHAVRDDASIQAQIIHHPTLTKKIGDEYISQIFVRSLDTQMLLAHFSEEIAKNRSITLDYL